MASLTSVTPEAHFGQLLRWLEQESQATAERLVGRISKLRGGEAERSGQALVDLAIYEEDAGMAGRWIVTLGKRNRTLRLPWTRLDTGSPVVLVPDDGTSDEHVRGIVSRRSETTIDVVISDSEELPEADTWRLNLSQDEIVTERQRAALRTAERAGGNRLAHLRRVLLGERAAEFSAERELTPLSTSLNASQLAAIRWALSAKELALIHGPPGTGKTTTVVELIRQAIRRGEKVLACAPSNLAVDNLLQRLVAAGERVVRIGHPARVLAELRARTLDVLVAEHNDVQVARKLVKDARALFRKAGKYTRAKPAAGEKRALRDEAKALLSDARRLEHSAVQHVLDTADVICATTTGLDAQLLGDRVFDWVVIDEACQSTEPPCWIPLQRADRVVLAGDHCQLPPTVISSDAQRQGFGVSLFERIVKLQGPTVARRLDLQYRMHQQISDFSSAEFYEQGLVAHESVAAHRLCDLSDITTLPLTETPLEFIDTAGAGHDEQNEPDGESLFNPGEAEVVERLLQSLVEAGVPAGDIAIITPYAAQVRWLRQLMTIDGLEVDTVDGFQGREKEAVIISLVRANPRGEIGFLGDKRRMNVAWTRARRKLIVVGDSATLANEPFYARMLEYCEQHSAYRSVWELA